MGTVDTDIKARLMAILCLVLMTGILPELLSGNTPAPILFRPDALIVFGLVYGLPVLVIREWSVRLSVRPFGTFLAGMAYGLINEGLLARTLFRQTGVPIDVFDDYGFVLGVNLPWALYITVWHGLSSVLFPIALTHFLLPGAARVAWLGKKTALALAFLSILLPTLFFLNDETSGPKGSLPMLAALWLAMAILATAASSFRQESALSPNPARFKPFLLGLAAFAPMIAVLLVAHAEAPLPIYFAGFAFIAWLWSMSIVRKHWQAALHWIALGWYLQMTGLGAIALVKTSPASVLAGFAAVALLIVLIVRADRKLAS